MQNILGTEMNEFVTNRQNSKIQFLQAENAQLQEDIKDIEQALRLNKEALKLSYEQRRFCGSSNISSSTTFGQSSLAIDGDIQGKIFEKLYAENKQLFDSLQRVTRDRNRAQTKVLIQEQVNEEAVSFQKDVIQELEEKILELRRIIHDKEYAIQELEKMKPIQNKDVAIKIREIVTPTEQSIKLHSEIENHKQLIKRLSIENQKVKECNSKIKAFNRVVKRDVIKIKVALKNPVNFKKMKEFIHNDRLEHGDEDLLINKEFIKEFYEEKDDWTEHQNLHQQQQLYNRNFYQNPNIKSKAQLIEDLSRLQMTVRNFKILYHREIDELQRFNTQLCETNQTLVDSQKPNQERQEKMKQEIDYYKQYYQKYMDKIRNRRMNNSSVTLDASPLPNKFHPPRHQPSQSMPQSFFIPSSPRQSGTHVMITEAMEHEEMTSRLTRTDRKVDAYGTPLTPTGNNNLQPLVSPSYAQQQQQRVLFFMQSKNPNAAGAEMTSMNVAVSAIGNMNNVSNNQQVAQQDYDFGYAYPSTARPFMNSNNNNTNNLNNNLNAVTPSSQDACFMDTSNQSFDEDPNQEMTLQQCKSYLLSLAKDFYENGNFKANQKQFGLTKLMKDRLQAGNSNCKIAPNLLTRAKRSLSDPLGYIFTEDPKQRLLEAEEKQRKQDSEHMKLFSVDMSIIGSTASANSGMRNNGKGSSQLIKNTLAMKKSAQLRPTNVNVLDANASFISTDNDLNF